MKTFFAFLLILSLATAFVVDQIHTAWNSNDLSELAISFVTPKTPSKQTTKVMYGTDSSNLDKEATGHNFLFGTSGHIFHIHNVVAKGLQANTKYYYKVGDSTSGTYSDVLSFYTKTSGWTYAVYGDFGLSNDRSLDKLVSEAGNVFDAVIHIGDFAYDLDSDSGKTGDEFMNAIQPIASKVPYMTVPGNHENYKNFTHYINRFSLVSEGVGKSSGSGVNLWYSFDRDNVHWVGIDTEVYAYSVDQSEIDNQLMWLEQDLIQANNNRQNVPWIVAYGHKGQWMDKVNFTGFEELLHSYGVDLYLCGHQHNYQRFLPFYQDQVDKQDVNTYYNPKFLVTIVVGSPGCRENISSGSGPKDAVASESMSYGFGHLRVANSTHLFFDWEQTSEPVNGAPLYTDTLTLIQQNHGPRN